MTQYKVILEYDGTDLIGWQEKPMDWKSFVNGLHGAEIRLEE